MPFAFIHLRPRPSLFLRRANQTIMLPSPLKTLGDKHKALPVPKKVRKATGRKVTVKKKVATKSKKKTNK